MQTLSTALLLALAPQNPGQAGTPVVSIEKIELRSYEPRNLDAEELFDIAVRTVGRSMYVSERGGMDAAPVSNLSLLADRIVMYDEPQYLARMQGALEALDRPSAGGGAEELVVREYVPRYITLQAAHSALSSFERVYVQRGSNRHVSSISRVDERNQLVIRDSEENLRQMGELLARLDVPEPQARLAFYLVQADPAGDGAGLPPDLVKNLGKIVPQFRFRALGFALLQASIAPGRSISLYIDGGPEAGFDLHFRALAYDGATTSLSVGDCTLEREDLQRGTSRQLFSTHAVFRGGEYAVLGATGAAPVFLVVHLTPGP